MTVNLSKLFWASAVLIVSVSVFSRASAEEESLDLTDAASILAGKLVEGAEGSLSSTLQQSQQFQAAMEDTTWPSTFRTFSTDEWSTLSHPGRGQTWGYNRLSTERRKALQEFSERELAGANKNTKTVVYPFGGPDVVYPFLFFPNMTTLVNVGIEKPGTFPDVVELEKNGALRGKIRDIGSAYHSLFLRSYYATSSMSYELKEFGAATMISVGLVLLDNEITSFTYLDFNEEGELKESEPGSRCIKIGYRKKGEELDRAVYYFRANLGDGDYAGLGAFPESDFSKFLESNNVDTAFYKASMYMPHNPWFEAINGFCASRKYILQSDTGLPFRLLDREGAKIKLFGHYSRPASDFGASVQWGLVRAYRAAIKEQGEAVKKVLNLDSRIWGSGVSEYESQGASVSWGGYMPHGGFDYASYYNSGVRSHYGSYINPKNSSVPLGERGRQALSNLIYVEN